MNQLRLNYCNIMHFSNGNRRDKENIIYWSNFENPLLAICEPIKDVMEIYCAGYYGITLEVVISGDIYE